MSRKKVFGISLPLGTAVDGVDHEEHLPKFKIPKIVVSATHIGN